MSAVSFTKVFRPYAFLAAVIFVAAGLLAPGFGLLESRHEYQITILEEMSSHTGEEFERLGEIYSLTSMFLAAVNGSIYLILPILSFGVISMLGDEREFGYVHYIKGRRGTAKYIAENIFGLILSAFLTVLIAGMLLLSVLAVRFSAAGFSLWQIGKTIFRLGLLSAIGGMLCYWILLIFRNKFYAFTVPILAFYFENELFIEVFQGRWGRFSIQGLLGYADWWSFFTVCFFLIVLLVNGIFHEERREKKYGC